MVNLAEVSYQTMVNLAEVSYQTMVNLAEVSYHLSWLIVHWLIYPVVSIMQLEI